MPNNQIRIHDNEITSYEFHLPEKRLTLNTSYQSENTKVHFLHVLAYSFDGAGDQNILFEITDNSIKGFVNWYASHADTQKALEYGFPLKGFPNPEALLTFLKAEGYQYYEVNASVGLDGFVLAKDMKMVPVV